jgi:glycosyltransferase involved in cell wall biosynthesis
MSNNGERIYYWVDHTSVCKVNSGVQRVTRCLARALLETRHDICPVVWDERIRALVPPTGGARRHLARWNGPQFPELGSITSVLAARLGLLPKRVLHSEEPLEGHWLLVPEVTHITPHATPPTRDVVTYCRTHGMRLAFVFYDALPLKHALYAAQREPHERYMAEIAEGDVIFPISQHSGGDLQSFLASKGEGKNKPIVAACPLPGEFPGVPRAQEAHAGSTHPLRILSVGSIDRRKNQAALIEAFVQWHDAHPTVPATLTLVGGLSPETAPAVKRATARSDVRFLATVDDAALIALYRSASFSVFPSLDEGFGLPILESLWFGRPCICANFGAMSEAAAGGGCVTVDTRSVDAIREAIGRLAGDESLRMRLSREAVGREIGTWHSYAAALVARLRQVH